MLMRWIWFIVPMSFCSEQDPFSVVVPRAPVYGLLGSSVTLPCSISPTLNAVNFEVLWYPPQKGHTPILFYQDREIRKNPRNLQYQGRVSLLGGLDEGNVSVKLENIRLEDKGEYICRVEKTDEGEEWYDEATVSLKVKVEGSAPVLSVSDVGEGKVNVSCHSFGWTPEPSLSWRDRDGRSLNNLSTEMFTEDSEGLVSVSSWLIISSSESEQLSCSVGFTESSSERKESQVQPHTSTESRERHHIMTVIIFISLSLLGIVGAAAYCMLHQEGLVCSGRTETEGIEEPLNDVEEQQMEEVQALGVPPDFIEPLNNVEEQLMEEVQAEGVPPHFIVNISIDPEETPDFLQITDGEKCVHCGQLIENHEDEERKIFTLCKESFRSGQQCWKVKVCNTPKEKISWFVGVATEEAEREYRIPLTPQNGFWVLCYEMEKQVYVTESPIMPTPQLDFSDDLTTVRVFLDCDNHTLSFYNAETQSVIHTFTNVTFRTSLRPLISPGIRDVIPVHIC